MTIRILTVGKKHEPWVEQGVARFLERLRGPFAAQMEIVPHSHREAPSAVEEESERLLKRVQSADCVILLDERGKNLTSPALSNYLVAHASHDIVIIIGGSYGVTPAVRDRANLVWSLSNLVFPHQLVRLILAEQLYRAQEISRQSKYHHQ